MKEKEIEDYLEKNLNQVEPGLSLIKRQKKVSMGIIDLFCKDKNGKYVIIELKKKSDTSVIAQLARYNVALIKEEGIPKNKLRTILVASKFSKNVEGTCKFFNFETKIISNKIIPAEREKLSDYLKPSDVKKLIRYIRQEEIVNQSMIARFLKIYHHTAVELINNLKEDNVINLTYFAGNKIITLKEN